jgi:imidazolonepropionase-like amidohydrolase
VYGPRLLILSLLLFFDVSFALSQSSTLVLIHVNVVDVRAGNVEQDRAVLIERDKIYDVVQTGAAHIPAGAKVINARGAYLIPGLWDMHVHSDGDRQALGRMLAAGITGIRDMGGDVHKVLMARKSIETGDWGGPKLVLAGPLLAGPPGDSDSGTWILRTPEEGRKAVESLAALNVDFIKVHDRLAREVYFAIADAAKKEHVPYAGHVTASITPLEASDAGQASIEHFEFVPKQCLPLLGDLSAGKDPPLEECTHSSFDAMFAHFVKNGTWLDPTVQSFRYFAPQQWSQILAEFRDLSAHFRNAHVQLLAGTDWSEFLESKGSRPGWCLHDELKIWVEAGFKPQEALQAATLNPAIFLKLENSLGAIKKGYTADLVLLKDNPLLDIANTTHILAVIVGGRFLDQAALNKRGAGKKRR